MSLLFLVAALTGLSSPLVHADTIPGKDSNVEKLKTLPTLLIQKKYAEAPLHPDRFAGGLSKIARTGAVIQKAKFALALNATAYHGVQ